MFTHDACMEHSKARAQGQVLRGMYSRAGSQGQLLKGQVVKGRYSRAGAQGQVLKKVCSHLMHVWNTTASKYAHT